jgi:O-antigen ligase
MPRAGSAGQSLGAFHARGFSGLARIILVVALAVFVFLACLRVVQNFGLQGLTVATGVLVALTLLAVLSLRNLQLAVLVWIVAISGFRSILIVDLPGIPDATPDRLLLIWIVFATLLRSFTEPGKPQPPFAPDVLMPTHTIYLLVSCLIANPIAFNLWTRSYLMPAAAYFFGKYLMSDVRWFQRMIRLFIAINLYMGITAVAEHMHWNALVWPASILEAERNWAGRSMGIFRQPAVLGIFIGMILPFQFYLHLTARQVWVRWLHLVGIVVCLVGLFFTYTRGGWLATGVGLIVLAITGSRIYLRRLVVYGVLMAFVGGTGLLSLKQDAFLQERMGNENTIEGRINLAFTAFRMWQANPVLGVGFKRFNELAMNYRETLEVPIYGLIKMGIDKDSSPHDIYIAVLAEEGLVGAALQVWIYIVILKVSFSMLRRLRRWDVDNVEACLVPPVFALMAVYLVGGTTFDYRFFETLNSMFYLFAGVLIGWSTAWAGSLARVRTVAS